MTTATETPATSTTTTGSPLELSLTGWMEALEIPGLSLAVIDDYRIAWAKGYGVRQAGGDDPVTPETLFQAASIAKAVTALALLHHVERRAWSLDADVNEYLRSWKLAGNELTAGHKVTLRHLLAHTAGITPGGFPGYEVGAPVPDLVQVLNGESPANNEPARVIATPGSAVRYSGLGYTILQLLLVDQLGRPFPRIMQETVLAPLGMNDSTFEQPLPPALSPRAASGHRASGEVVPGKWYVHPELAAAALWTTPSDLAKFAIEVAKSKSGRSNRVLSPEGTRRMLARHEGDMGLGLVIDPEDEHGFFAHSGGNQGYRCRLWAFADAGKGIVIMTNSDAGGLLFASVIASVANEYQWPSGKGRDVPPGIADRIREIIQRVEVDVDPAVLARYVGRYELAPGMQFDVILEGGELTVQLADQPRFPVYPESETKFFYKVVDAQITFVEDDSGAVSGLVLHQGGRDQPARKVE